MKDPKMKINGGLYLVVDPTPGLNDVLPKITAALDGGVDVVQLFNFRGSEEQRDDVILKICKVVHSYHVPVLINEQWALLKTFPLDGVHFDVIPPDLEQIRREINRPFLTGLTCGNDMSTIQWAIDNKLDYISFCSMFPSETATSCEFVQPETIIKTRALTKMPIYAAGGITPENLPALLPLGIDGVALVSGIMRSNDPEGTANTFKQALAMKHKNSRS